MQKLTQKYTLITLLAPIKEGTEFAWTDWPLHVTIADTFAIDTEGTGIVRKLTALARSNKTFATTITGDEYFGPEKQTHVMILDMSKELVQFHYDVVALLKDNGTVFNNPQYIDAGYRAHATVLPGARLRRGDEVRFGQMSLIDMFPGGDPYMRKVLKTLVFSGI